MTREDFEAHAHAPRRELRRQPAGGGREDPLPARDLRPRPVPPLPVEPRPREDDARDRALRHRGRARRARRGGAPAIAYGSRVTDVVERYLTLGSGSAGTSTGSSTPTTGRRARRGRRRRGSWSTRGELAADADALAQPSERRSSSRSGSGWLGDQIRGLRTYAGVLAGESISYVDEVERCYGVRPAPGPTMLQRGARAARRAAAGRRDLLERSTPGAAGAVSVRPARAGARRSLAESCARATPLRVVDLPDGEELEAR